MAHVALAEPDSLQPVVVSLACPEGLYPSVGRAHPAAIRQERAIRDLLGLHAADSPDERPWLDHGIWPVATPLGAAVARRPEPVAYRFLPAAGEHLHQIPVGPVHAGIIEPGHFRFHASGETVVRLEARLGYVHRGLESLMQGAPLDRAARLAGRISGDATVSWALAFARAAEVALQVEPPARAVWLRALLAELERIANHLGDFGAICNDAAFVLIHNHTAILREQVLRTAHACFGHRLMMDRIVPGGIASDLDAAGTARLRDLLALIQARLPELVALYDDTASLQDRTVGTGILKPALARRFGAGGHVGRASGRAVDARKSPGYPPYDRLDFQIPVREEGDVDARVRIRLAEILASLALIEQILLGLPGGGIHAELPARDAPAEGLALVESFRGDVLVWLRIGADGRVLACHARDPSWFQWPLLEAVIEDNIVADFPLCNKSFNCSYAGCDL
jgi:Ni,Fe-hydrogenase III large subunit